MSGILQSPLDIYTKETTELEGQNIAEAVQRCESCVKHGQNAEVAIGLARKSLARDCNKAKEQMQSRFLDIHSLLKLHQQQALQQITQIQSSTDTFLTEQTNLLDSHMQSLSMAIELKEVLCKSTDLPDFEYLGSSALQHIKSLENIEIPLAPCCRPDFSFDFNFDWSDHINSLGKISLGTSSDSSEITMSLLKNLDNVDDFALETVKLFAQGNYSQVHKNCLVMTSFSSPASEPGLTDAIANLLLNCIFSLQPNLFSAQQPFSVYPYDEYLDNAIKASPNSHQFMLKVAERASTSAEQCVSATGHFLCGFIYHWPIGVTQDTSVALQQYCMSDLHNNSLAQYYLGWCYQYGHGVHKNPEEAVRLYRLATDRGNGLAMCQLGWCFETGNGVKKDVTESYNLFHTAAEAGNAPSQYNLGLYFFLGKGGVTTNPQQGFHWYKVSSAQGYPSAQCNLAECYSTGNGTDKDVTEAVRLYELAAAQKNTGAQEALKKLRATLATIRSPTSKKGKRKHKTTAE
ncbi:sel1 repeat family protein [Pelomyxa schiedti]|nr:sel1 repeat family protein [Pelomyxa schiedti]